MKRISIPEFEKLKGLVWVEYRLVDFPDTIAELQIQQGEN
jgi:hypothetical protein